MKLLYVKIYYFYLSYLYYSLYWNQKRCQPAHTGDIFFAKTYYFKFKLVVVYFFTKLVDESCRRLFAAKAESESSA